MGQKEMRQKEMRPKKMLKASSSALLLAGASGLLAACFFPYFSGESASAGEWQLAVSSEDSWRVMDGENGTDASQNATGPGFAANKEILPITLGVSYYEEQWALENRGNLRRTLRYYESGRTNEDGSRERGSWKEWVDQGVAGIDIGVGPAWDFYEASQARRPVTVAVIDSGIDTSHPDLAGSIWVNTDEIPGYGIDNDGNGYVDDVNGWNFYNGNADVSAAGEEEHGTHGAGTIAAAWDGQGITGIADGNWVKIMVLKVINTQDGQGISEHVKAAIRYAQENGADICNMSMGTTTYDPELEAMIAESPMLFVIAAGNGDETGMGLNLEENPIYPAAYTSENILSVANLMFDGELEESSNYGPVSVDIAAPGTHILSTVPGGYAYLSGTSMSAPEVAGAAALLYSCRLDLDLTGVRNAILASAAPLESLSGKVSAGGMLDVGAAMTYGLR